MCPRTKFGFRFQRSKPRETRPFSVSSAAPGGWVSRLQKLSCPSPISPVSKCMWPREASFGPHSRAFNWSNCRWIPVFSAPQRMKHPTADRGLPGGNPNSNRINHTRALAPSRYIKGERGLNTTLSKPSERPIVTLRYQKILVFCDRDSSFSAWGVRGYQFPGRLRGCTSTPRTTTHAGPTFPYLGHIPMVAYPNDTDHSVRQSSASTSALMIQHTFLTSQPMYVGPTEDRPKKHGHKPCAASARSETPASSTISAFPWRSFRSSIMLCCRQPPKSLRL